MCLQIRADLEYQHDVDDQNLDLDTKIVPASTCSSTISIFSDLNMRFCAVASASEKRQGTIEVLHTVQPLQALLPWVLRLRFFITHVEGQGQATL